MWGGRAVGVQRGGWFSEVAEWGEGGGATGRSAGHMQYYRAL